MPSGGASAVTIASEVPCGVVAYVFSRATVSAQDFTAALVLQATPSKMAAPRRAVSITRSP